MYSKNTYPLPKTNLIGRLTCLGLFPAILACSISESVPPPPSYAPLPPEAVSENPAGLDPLMQEMPYEVKGRIYYPIRNAQAYEEEGTASWYGPDFHGKLTSNKEVYDMNGLTAAHKTLPFGTLVKVINLENNREVVVRINDRGPFAGDRIIDLTRAAAQQLRIIRKGTGHVRVMVLRSDHPRASQNISPTGPYSVQVAAFRKKDNALRLKQQLENSRLNTYLMGSTKAYRVLVGRHNRFDAALKVRDTIRNQGFPEAFIITYPTNCSGECINETAHP